jgi:hypothetical protein
MLWLRRCLVVVPAAFFVGLAFIWSCGGGGGGPSIAASPSPFALISVAICAGTPFFPTPTPSPAQFKPRAEAKAPTPTPTPMCSPIAAASIAPSDTIFLNAQGTFAKGKGRQFRDISEHSTTLWFFGGLVQSTPGIYVAPAADECACVRAGTSGGLSSQTVVITVGSPSPACTPMVCP